MPVFTVHAPPADDESQRVSPDRFLLVRDGFYVWAFVFGPFWLLYRRLWLAVIGYGLVTAAAAVALAALQAGAGARLLVTLLIASLLGLEAGSLWRWTLARRGWRQIDLTVADDQEAAERRFFDRWTAGQPHAAGYPLSTDRGAPPPARSIPLPASSLYADVVGSFPRPGAPR